MWILPFHICGSSACFYGLLALFFNVAPLLSNLPHFATAPPLMIIFTPQKTAFLREHSILFEKAELLGAGDMFMDDFFGAWIECFKEMDFLRADSDIQTFIKRRMVKLLRDKLTVILNTQTLDEKALLALHSPVSIRKASEDGLEGPPRYNPTRALLQRGLLPRPTGSKRRRARLDASVVVPPIIPKKLAVH
ncbi:hypothetical protein PC9H_004331 [Pleurotus ostreatus]|uniref:Uncharacterized protein n=1 Tax=Pleurotus ostreatus TaxID=5322 RepID=A0A8H7A7H9_PLEOS|nr:uncharacterized protein PC9H_004331 [Pleurotus ostreatus]KAF7437490.1 hypothetical protein PC9H_004331 [Pleurotus ostreatus]KAJ8703434.1 hypothetical protein PTI98_002056 [Pleurotus ostreatus]